MLRVVLSILIGVGLNTTVRAEEQEEEPIIKYGIMTAVVAVVALGGRSLVKYIKKNPDRILRKIDPEKFTGEGVPLAQLKAKGISSSKLKARGYTEFRVGLERRVFADGHTPEDRLTRHLTALDAQKLKEGIVIEELVATLKLPEDFYLNSALDRTKYAVHLDHIFAIDSTPVAQAVSYLDTIDVEILQKGLPIEKIQSNIVSKQLSKDDLRAATTKMQNKTKLNIVDIEMAGKKEMYVFADGFTPTEQIKTYLDGLDNRQMYHGVRVEKLADNVSYRQAHWSDEDFHAALLAHIDGDEYRLRWIGREDQQKVAVILHKTQKGEITQTRARLEGIMHKTMSEGVYADEAAAVKSDQLNINELEITMRKEMSENVYSDQLNIDDLNKAVREATASAEAKISDDFLASVSNIVEGVDGDFQAYLEVGNIQEVIWQLRERGLVKHAATLEKLVTDVLQNAEMAVEDKRTFGGITGARELEFTNGVRAVAKSWDQAKAIAMSELDKLIGTNIFPLTVHRKFAQGRDYVLQLFIERAKHYTEPPLVGYDESVQALTETRRANTLALLSAYWDSGFHNRMIPSRGRAFMIDGGEALSYEEGLRGIFVRVGDVKPHGKRSYSSGELYYRGQQPAKFVLKEETAAGIFAGLHYTDAQFLTRLAEVSDKDLQKVVEPVLACFEQKELNILQKLAPEKSLYDYNFAQYANHPEIEHLRTFYRDAGADANRLDEVIARRLEFYRDVKIAPMYMRAVIDEYLDAAALLQKHEKSVKKAG